MEPPATGGGEQTTHTAETATTSDTGDGGGNKTNSSSDVTLGAHTLSSAETSLDLNPTPPSSSQSGGTLTTSSPHDEETETTATVEEGQEEEEDVSPSSSKEVENGDNERKVSSPESFVSGSEEEEEIVVPPSSSTLMGGGDEDESKQPEVEDDDNSDDDDGEKGDVLAPLDTAAASMASISEQSSFRGDPEGEKAGSLESLHAERMQPTDDDTPSPQSKSSSDPTFADQSDVISPSQRSHMSGDSIESDSNVPVSASEFGTSSNAMASSSRIVQQQQDPSQQQQQRPSASTTTGEKVQRATFPSSGILFALAIAIVLVVGGIVTGMTVYGRTPNVTDPLPVPTISPAPTPIGQTGAPSIFVPTATPSIEPTFSVDVFFDLFATVVGPTVYEEGTAAYLAAQWMVEDDPAGYPLNFNSLSEEAWTQRYLLVYLYYVTTYNRQTEWLSCNPPPTDAPFETSCVFANPTEVPGGRIIYDYVPSNRWLSAAPDCDWAGISCQTVPDGVSGGRLSVTSINLAGQDLVGSVVTELVQLPDLVLLDLSHNGLGGTLYDGYRELQALHLQNNALTGTIPSNFFDNESVMQRLNVGSNLLNGTLPGEVGLASKLTGLYIYDNDFTGTIPVLGNMPLKFFQAYSNNFTGILPFDLFFGVWAETITEWWVYDNQLTGELSQNMNLFPNLRDFRVGRNQLRGTIPLSTYTLPRLFRLELNDNQLTGTLDPSIVDLISLETFDVSGNAINGTVPEEIADIPVLRNVLVQDTLIDGTIPTELCFLPSMEVLVADCLPDFSPPNECFCCTTCCERGTDVCITY